MADKTHIGMWLCCITAMVVLLALTPGIGESHANICDIIDHPYDRYRTYSAIILAEVIDVEPFSDVYERNGKSYNGEKYVLRNIKDYKGDLPETFTVTSTFDSDASYSLDYGRVYFLNGHVADNTMGLINCGTYPVEDTVNFTGSNQQIHDWYVDTYEEFDAFFEKEVNLPSPKAQQEDSVRFESLVCRFDLVPVLTVSGSFACVLHDTKAILSARGLLEGFDYSVLDRTVVMEQESGDEVVLRYWLEYGDATVIKVEEAEHGWSTLQMESTEGGRMLLAIPNGKEDRAGVMGLVSQAPGSVIGAHTKTLHVDDKNTVFKVTFQNGDVYLSFYR